MVEPCKQKERETITVSPHFRCKENNKKDGPRNPFHLPLEDSPPAMKRAREPSLRAREAASPPHKRAPKRSLLEPPAARESGAKPAVAANPELLEKVRAMLRSSQTPVTAHANRDEPGLLERVRAMLKGALTPVTAHADRVEPAENQSPSKTTLLGRVRAMLANNRAAVKVIGEAPKRSRNDARRRGH